MAVSAGACRCFRVENLVSLIFNTVRCPIDQLQPFLPAPPGRLAAADAEVLVALIDADRISRDDAMINLRTTVGDLQDR